MRPPTPHRSAADQPTQPAEGRADDDDDQQSRNSLPRPRRLDRQKQEKGRPALREAAFLRLAPAVLSEYCRGGTD
jgi:hypothetical protein